MLLFQHNFIKYRLFKERIVAFENPLKDINFQKLKLNRFSLFRFKYVLEKNIYMEIETMNTEFSQVLMDLKQAEQNFEYASPEFVDIAIIQLLAARMKVDMLYCLKKQNSPTTMSLQPNLPR